MIDCLAHRVKYWLTFNEQQNIFHAESVLASAIYAPARNPAGNSCSTIRWWRTYGADQEYLHQTRPGQLMYGMLAHQLIQRATCKTSIFWVPSSTTSSSTRNLPLRVSLQGRLARR